MKHLNTPTDDLPQVEMLSSEFFETTTQFRQQPDTTTPHHKDRDVEENSRMSSIIDWNNDEQITRQVQKQLRMQSNERDDMSFPGGGVRLSEYFGAETVEEINEQMLPNDKIQCKLAWCIIIRV
jgi:hypothetical protein